MGNEQSHGTYLESQMATATGKDVSTLQNHYTDFQKDCPNGLLSPQKFTELCEKVLGSSKAEEFKTRAFGRFGKHSNGTINFRDFLMVVHLTSNGSPEDKLRTMFSLYDKDGNGSIDAAEMERGVCCLLRSMQTLMWVCCSVLRDVYQMMGECEFGQGKAMFEMMDKDSDGKITQEEFIKASMEDVELCKMLSMKN